MSFVSRQYISDMEPNPYEKYKRKDASAVGEIENNPYEKYRVKEERGTGAIQESIHSEKETQRANRKSENEENGKEAIRNIARTGSNLGTLAAGLPGSLLSLPYTGISKAIESVTGEKQTPYEQSYLGKILPTSHTLKTGVQAEFPDYLTPQTKFEKFADDIIEDTALLWNPAAKGTQLVSKVPKLVRNFGKAIGANLGGLGVEEMTGNKTAGDLTKGGLLFLSSLLDQPSVYKQVGELYKDAEAGINASSFMDVNRDTGKLRNISDQITKGRPIKNLSENEKWVIDQVDKVKSLIKSGKLSVEQAWAQKKSLNQELQKKIYDIPWSQRKSIRNQAKQVNGWLSDQLGKYAHQNPQFGKPFQAAEEAFGTLAKSNFISGWVKDNLKSTPLTHGLIYLFGKGAAIGAAPLAGVAQLTKLIYRIGASPTLKNMYGKALKSAAEEDTKAFAKYFSELDKGLAEQE